MQYIQQGLRCNALVCMDSMRPTHTLQCNMSVTKPQSGQKPQNAALAQADGRFAVASVAEGLKWQE
jgi:hypothetical protein